MKKNNIIFLFLIVPYFVFGQKETNIWYFGTYAGLDFNSGSAVALTNGSLNTAEGCASVADTNGALIFYTDGVTVWNRNHSPMPNGTGLFGDGSTSQSAIIVPLPGNADQYYVFTQDNYVGIKGFCYSIVDMTLQGGDGDITTKNAFLMGNTTERLTAVQHINGIDYWIIVHGWNSNVFYTYLLTSSGITFTPVSSATGSYYGTSWLDYAGCLKVSHDGTKLASTIYDSGFIEIYDFDNSSGLITNPATSGSIYSNAYGLEFSPDNSKLYLSLANNGNVFQFDMLAGSPAAIFASATLIGNSISQASALQLGSDGRIYLARFNSDYLGVIQYPNSSSLACQYSDYGIYLGGQSSAGGLPNFIPTIFTQSITITNSCFGDSTYFSIPGSASLIGIQWDFGDSLSGANNMAYAINPAHLYTAPGNYTIQLIQYFVNGNTDTSYVQLTIRSVPQINLGADTTFCLGSQYLIQVASGYWSYLWQDNSTDSVFTATSSGTYWVTVTDNGCVATDSLTLNVVACNVPVVNFISSDTVFCDNKCLDFTDLSTNNPTTWQWSFPGAVPAFSTDQHPSNICYNVYGSFDVTLIACNGTGCDTLFMPSFITEFQLPAQPVITQSNDTLYSTPANTYAWYNANNPGTIIATGSFLVIQSGGDYFVIVGDSLGCKNSSALFVATNVETINDNENAIIIFPNPVINEVNIVLNRFLKGEPIEIVILNLTGQQVFCSERSEQKNVIDLKDIANGIYFIHLRTPDEFIFKKIIINH